MRVAAAGLTLCLAMMAAPAMADCDEGFALLFACSFPERNAEVELCRRDGLGQTSALRYSYRTAGEAELEFETSEWTSFFREQVRGINGLGYGTAASNKGTWYGILVDERLMFRSSEGTPSPNPAVLEVYASEAQMQDDAAAPIARRVCDPNSIEMDHDRFGPG
ncbi:hypothetical protein [Gemmobacter serpentinus]|uniref:hypothetical protein n=1 Tax=Gemmobacter serpentinus TaxID=2652247 RepID=UPI00124EF403|nr:hypothetical protein [Gemmobacter serpentinus]